MFDALGLSLRKSLALPGLVGLALALIVTTFHLRALAADPSIFVRAAPSMADPRHTPASLRVMQPDQAYDGEYFYRLALDPLVVRDVGITLDNPSYRHQRILYPLLVRFMSLGQDDWVPWVMVIVNVAGLALLGLLGPRYALDLGRPAWSGIALPLYVGFTFTLARDLSKIVQACLLVGMLLALNCGRALWAAGLMALAVLARETALLLAIALLATAVKEWAVGSPRRVTPVAPIGSARRITPVAAAAGAGICCYLAVQVVL